VNLILDGVRPLFGGHEKFVFRQAWLKKGVDLTTQNELIFTRDEPDSESSNRLDDQHLPPPAGGYKTHILQATVDRLILIHQCQET
jgi:hypothetical protein